MSKKRNIEHDGIIVSMSDDNMLVEIVNSSACAECHAKGLCSAADSKKKLIDVKKQPDAVHAVGDRVTVVGEERMGILAVILAYVVPLVLLVGVLCVCTYAGKSDAFGGVAAIASLIPYYCALYLLRNKLHKTFIFKTKIN